MRVRSGDDNKFYFRSERFYQINNGWWVSTRENSELGPFNSEEDASIELCMYIRKINMFDSQIA